MSKGDFQQSMDVLIEQAQGHWKGSVEVDQVYAHYQEVHPEFRHPRGGQAFYLRDSIYLGQHLRTIAEHLIDDSGVNVEKALVTVVENISKGVAHRAPVEFDDLRRSAHPKVTVDGATVYDRPPEVRRLGPVELRLKGRLRYLFDQHRRS